MAVLLQQKGAAMLHHLFVTEDRGERDVVVDCHRTRMFRVPFATLPI